MRVTELELNGWEKWRTSMIKDNSFRFKIIGEARTPNKEKQFIVKAVDRYGRKISLLKKLNEGRW